MNSVYADVVVIGGGIAGASLAALLAPERRVVILERESQPGYHSTGRSAAIFIESYGSAPVRALTRASRSFFVSPPPGFSPHALFRDRGALYIARADQRPALDALAALPDVAARSVALDEAAARKLCPALRPDYVDGAIYEAGCFDLDVHAIHNGYLAQFRHAGGTLVLDADVTAIERDGAWRVTTSAGSFCAPLVVNAAGAWADEIADLAGVARVGLTPCRRTALTIAAPDGVDIEHWPMVIDAAEGFYFKPDAGRLLLSPADETPSPPCDAQPEELEVATAAHLFEQLTAVAVPRVLSRWAGLRSFVADRNPVIGPDPAAPGFFWLAGQGGYGIQTAPAAAALARDLILGRPPVGALDGLDPRELSPGRTAIAAV